MLQDGGVRGEFGSGFGKRGRGQRKEFSIPVSQPFCVPAPGPGPGRQCEGAAVPEDDASPRWRSPRWATPGPRHAGTVVHRSADTPSTCHGRVEGRGPLAPWVTSCHLLAV